MGGKTTKDARYEHRILSEADDSPSQLAERFHITLDDLLEVNGLNHYDWQETWKTGATILVPLKKSPHTGLKYYSYDFAAEPRPLEEIIKLKDARFPRWNLLGLSAKQVWFHFENRSFRAWQIKQGGEMGRLFGKKRSEPAPVLRLPFSPEMVDVKIKVLDADIPGAEKPIGKVFVELVNVTRALTKEDGIAALSVEAGEGYDLQVHHPLLRAANKTSGPYWFSQDVATKQPKKELRRGVTGIVFDKEHAKFEVKMARDFHHVDVKALPDGTVVSDLALQAVNEAVLVAAANQHDSDNPNKLMFAAQAVRELRRNYQKDAAVSFVIFDIGYTDEQMKLIKDAALAQNPAVELVKVSSLGELVNYINTRDKTGAHDLRSEEHIYVKHLKIFSHGKPSAITFALDDPKDRSLRFEIKDIAKLKPGAFAGSAQLFSYACRTGNVYDDGLTGSFPAGEWKKLAKPEESLAQKLADHLAIDVYGYVSRTNYVPTWHDVDCTRSYVIFKDCASSDPAYTRAYVHKDHWLWNPQGAFNPPVGSLDDPGGLKEYDGTGMFLFRKGAAPTRAGSR